jgi:hypothetical protein
MSLRPSNLPKLAECACYESDPNPGPAAERGSALDSLFRSRMAGTPDQAEMFYQPTETDLAAVEWAVTTVKALSGGNDVITCEQDCRVAIPGFENGGTADALIPDKLAHADLKTGQKRNYREQMAAYALGLMQAHFSSEWTCHLLFCDLREVETCKFTYDQAHDLVEAVIQAFHDPGKKPVPCEYCGWCAKADTCSARRAIVAQTLPVADPGFDFDAVVSEPERLGRFLTACTVLDDFRERAKKIAIERIKTGGSVPGWRLVTRKGSEFVDCETVGHHIGAMGFGPVLAAYGNLSAAKFRDLWSKRMPSDKPFPDEAVKHAAPSTYLKPTPNTEPPCPHTTPTPQPNAPTTSIRAITKSKSSMRLRLSARATTR